MVAWVRIPGLSEAFYKRNLLKKIDSLIGRVVKIDVQTSKGTTNKNHRVEYESLPQICFGCGKFGHLLDACPKKKNDMTNRVDITSGKGSIRVSDEYLVQTRVETENYADWMLVGR